METDSAKQIHAEFPEVSSRPKHELFNPDISLDNIIAEFSDLKEVESNLESIVAAAHELVRRHQIQAEFFADKAQTLLFIALAHRLSEIQHLPQEQRQQDETFINSATILLTLKKSGHFDELRESIGSQYIIPEETEVAVYEKFTNHQLTAELMQAIEKGMLDQVKQRLGITVDNESPYELKVLSIGDEFSAHGMQPHVSQEMSEDYNHPDWPETNINFDLYKEWIKGLEKRKEDFGAAIGRPGDVPLAWITHLGNRQFLCLPQPFAEKLLHPDQQRAKYYEDADRQRDFAILEHEYVHTQNGLPLNGQIFFGMALEERRAELFSGDRQGYGDIKAFFSDLEVINGFNIKEFLVNTKTKEPAEVYRDLAATIGLQATLELSLITPKAYVSETRPLQEAIAVYNSKSTFLQKAYANAKEEGQTSEIKQRARVRAEQVAKSGIDLDMWLSIRSMDDSSEAVTQLIKEALIAMGASAVVSAGG